MDIEIGKNYENKKERLIELIRKGINPLETIAENHACYLCRKHIEGKMLVLKMVKNRGISRFYIDEVRYNQARR